MKSISEQGVPEALTKAEPYKLLNEPALAESICLDVLAIAPDQQQAMISLLLARTDQFHSKVNAKAAQDVLARIKGDYERDSYAGFIWERLGNTRVRERSSEAAAGTYHALLAAMDHYEKAIKVAPPGNDDAILRWNTCTRTIMQYQDIQALPDQSPADAWVREEAGSRIADA